MPCPALMLDETLPIRKLLHRLFFSSLPPRDRATRRPQRRIRRTSHINHRAGAPCPPRRAFAP